MQRTLLLEQDREREKQWMICRMNYAYFEINFQMKLPSCCLRYQHISRDDSQFTSYEQISREISKIHEISLAAAIMAWIVCIVITIVSLALSLYVCVCFFFAIVSLVEIPQWRTPAYRHSTHIDHRWLGKNNWPYCTLWSSISCDPLMIKSVRCAHQNKNIPAWILMKRNCWQIGQMIDIQRRQWQMMCEPYFIQSLRFQIWIENRAKVSTENSVSSV